VSKGVGLATSDSKAASGSREESDAQEEEGKRGKEGGGRGVCTRGTGDEGSDRQGMGAL
jgi:hypothetical protein